MSSAASRNDTNAAQAREATKAKAKAKATPCPVCRTGFGLRSLPQHIRDEHPTAVTDKEDPHYQDVEDFRATYPNLVRRCGKCHQLLAAAGMARHRDSCKKNAPAAPAPASRPAQPVQLPEGYEHKVEPRVNASYVRWREWGGDDDNDGGDGAGDGEGNGRGAQEEAPVPGPEPEPEQKQEPEAERDGEGEPLQPSAEERQHIGGAAAVFMTNQGPLVRNIPKDAMPVWRSLVHGRLLECALLPPGDEWDEALLQLLRVAGALRRRRGGRGRNGLRKLIAQMTQANVPVPSSVSQEAGEAQARAERAGSAAADDGGQLRPDSEEDARAARRAAWLVSQGLASKAIAVLSRRKRALPLTPDVEARIKEFFPEPAFDDSIGPPPAADAGAARVTFRADDPAVRAHVRRMLYNQSAGGPSGLTGAHLRCVLQDETAYAALLNVMERIANGEVGPMASAALLAARITPLADVPEEGQPEPAEPKLRPIACSEVFTRMAGSAVNAVVKDAAVTYFGSRQQGCGAPGGAQAAGSHDLHAHKSGHLVISHDVKTAYPTVSRASVVEEASKIPAFSPIMPHLRWLLGSEQVMIGGPPGKAHIVCNQKTGLQQGCALSPLMFCLAIDSHLREAQAVHPRRYGTSVCGYIDNVSIVGEPKMAVAAAEALIESIGARPGEDLHLKWAAHHVVLPHEQLRSEHWSEEDRAAVDEYVAKYETADAGCHPTALGVPLGSDEHIAAQLVPQFERNHGRCVRALLDGGNCLSTQTRLLLLRYLLNGAATHALRVLPPRLTRGLAQHLDDIVERFVEQHVLDVDHIPMEEAARAAALQQARLRVSEGGLGFMSLSDVAPVAYVAGYAQAWQAQTICTGPDETWAQGALDECWDSGPVRAARAETEDLLPENASVSAFFSKFHLPGDAAHATVPGRWDASLASDPVPLVVGDAHQRNFTRKLQSKLLAPFKRHAAKYFAQEGGPAVQHRLRAASGPGASGFLMCLPTSPLTTIGDAQFKTALRLRLGTPFADLTSLPPRCVCEADLSANAYHLLACPKLCAAGGRQSLRAEWAASTWNERHALVKEALAVMLSAAGVCVVDEPGPLNGPGDDGSGDGAPMPDQLLTFVSHGDGNARAIRRVCTDVTVVECNTASRVAKDADALNATASHKRNKHKAAAAKAGVSFVPLVASSLGTLHTDFRKFLQLDDVRLDDDHLFLTFGGRLAFKTRLKDSVSCAIARGTAYVAIVAAERLAFSASGRHLDDQHDLHQQVAIRHKPPKGRARPAQRGGVGHAAEAPSV
jgi:hypothetical protein